MIKAAPSDRVKSRRLPPVLTLGLRPFFLMAAIFAFLSIGVWILTFRGVGGFDPAHGAMAWHMHEMVFGYTSAVLAGFLLTAIPNWTGRPPVKGAPLAALALLWLCGRLAMAWSPLSMAAWVDALFLPVMAVVAGREIIGGQNWRNLAVLIPVSVFALANILFHLQSAGTLPGDYALRLGMAAIGLLLMLIGGRIIPAFSRNWLKQQGGERLPAEFSRFDRISLALAVVALVFWTVYPLSLAAGALQVAAAVLQGIRLGRWAGLATRGNPILFVLHLFFALVAAGLLLLGIAGVLGSYPLYVAGLHLFGIGGIGGMTFAVMSRAGLGHTGHPLRSGFLLNIGYACLVLAALLRTIAGAMPDAGPWIDAAGGFWMAAFALFVVKLGSALLTPRSDGK